MVNTSNFLRCTRITDFKNIFLWKSTITLRHTAFWFYNKVDLECVLPRFSWRVGLHRRRSVSAPLILVAPLSTSTSTSLYLSQFCLILHFTISCSPFFPFHGFVFCHFPSHSFTPLTFFSHSILCRVCRAPCREGTCSHYLPSSEQPHFSPQRIPPQLVSNSHLIPPWLRTLRLPTFTCLLSTDQCHQCQWL